MSTTANIANAVARRKPLLATLSSGAGLLALVLAHAGFTTSAVAQGWGEKTTTEKTKPAASKKEAAPAKAETAKTAEAKPVDFQTSKRPA